MKLFTPLFLLFSLQLSFCQEYFFEKPSEEKIIDVFPLKWKTPIGLTTHRTNLIFKDNKVFIGCKDDGKINNGLYVINANTGEIIKHIIHEDTTLDNDVAGLAYGNNNIYFGTDAGYVYSYNLDLELEWKKNVKQNRNDTCWRGDDPVMTPYLSNPYQVVAAPSLAYFDNDSILDIVIAMESGDVYLLDGKTGNIKWHTSGDEHNRCCFRDRYDDENNPYHTNRFLGTPAIFDFNKDSVPDIVLESEYRIQCAASVNESFLILNGKTGFPLDQLFLGTPWNSIINSTKIMVSDTDTSIWCLNNKAQVSLLKYQNDTYSYTIPDPIEGAKDSHQNRPVFQGNPVMTRDSSFCFGSSPTNKKYSGIHFWNDAKNIDIFYSSGDVTATAIVADILNIGKEQIIIPSQTGELFILDAETGELQKRLNMNRTISEDSSFYSNEISPMGTQSSVFIQDIDSDGKLELLITSLEGYLYCYETSSTAKLGSLSQLFVNEQNTGVVDWTSESPKSKNSRKKKRKKK